MAPEPPLSLTMLIAYNRTVFLDDTIVHRNHQPTSHGTSKNSSSRTWRVYIEPLRAMGSRRRRVPLACTQFCGFDVAKVLDSGAVPTIVFDVCAVLCSRQFRHCQVPLQAESQQASRRF